MVLSTTLPRNQQKQNEIKYISQKQSMNCGPVAIINAMKWARVRADYERIYQAVQCNGYGTSLKTFDAILRQELHTKCDIFLSSAEKTSYRNMENFLKNCGSIIVCSRNHITFFSSIVHECWIAHNFSGLPTIPCTVFEILNFLFFKEEHSTITENAILWFLKRKTVKELKKL